MVLRASCFVLLATILAVPCVADDDATAIVRAAIDHWRGDMSYSEFTMIIHRPDWERSMTMRGWTQGDDNTLVRVSQPKKDAGNGTLMKGGSMWTFSPRINRVIKVPSSMMGQNWMGSDFSNKDISKSTEILDQYTHRLIDQSSRDGFTVYTIEAIPHEDAAIVWGKKILRIREDFVLLEEQYWDQDGVLVKSMRTLEVQEMSGRAVATNMRMQKADTEEEWTQVQVQTIEFDLQLSPRIFTLSYLRNPRE